MDSDVLNIRPFERTKADYLAFVRIENAIWSDYPTSVEETKHRDNTRDPQYMFQHFLAESQGEIVATFMCCEPYWALKPGKYYLTISVHPDHQRQGIGGACYRHLLGVLSAYDVQVLNSDTLESQLGAVRFLTRRGFVQTLREQISHLDVTHFDTEPYAERLARVAAMGIQIEPLSELKASFPDWERRLYDLEWTLMEDVPSTDPLTPPTFENYVERTLRAPWFIPEAQFIALDVERWVGCTGLWGVQADPDRLQNALTGVARDYRRRGIAIALKVHAINFARQKGFKLIVTDNEENNPMYLINQKLGFEPQPAWLEFTKPLTQSV